MSLSLPSHLSFTPSSKALVSLFKLEGMKIAITKLEPAPLNLAKQLAEKHLIVGVLPRELQDKSPILQKVEKSENGEAPNTAVASSTSIAGSVTSFNKPSLQASEIDCVSHRKKFGGVMSEKSIQDLRSNKDWRVTLKEVSIPS